MRKKIPIHVPKKLGYFWTWCLICKNGMLSNGRSSKYEDCDRIGVMGTNFYTDEEHEEHIGKRSAAGLYCWDCGLTLCEGGEQAIHASTHEWFSSCPSCGGEHEEEGLGKSSVGRELGFNKAPPGRKSGVRSCSSFRWDMDPREVEKLDKIWNEYGDEFTQEEFHAILYECPVQYFDTIGKGYT